VRSGLPEFHANDHHLIVFKLLLRPPLRHNGQVSRQTITRRPDEPKFEIGDTVPVKEGVVGVVLARYMPSGDGRNEVHYIVELRSNESAQP
jgi:hypothetical protein